MNRATLELLGLALIVVLIAKACTASQSNEAALATIRAGRYTQDSLKGRLAETTIALDSARHAVRDYASRYSAIRDGVTVTASDTVYVTREFVAVADSMVRECTSLASACAEYRSTTEKLLASKDAEIALWQGTYNGYAHPKCGRKCGFALGVVSTFAAAWFVSAANNAARRP